MVTVQPAELLPAIAAFRSDLCIFGTDPMKAQYLRASGRKHVQETQRERGIYKFRALFAFPYSSPACLLPAFSYPFTAPAATPLMMCFWQDR